MKKIKYIIFLILLISYQTMKADSYALSATCSSGELSITRHNLTAGTSAVVNSGHSCVGLNTPHAVDSINGIFYIEQSGSGATLAYNYEKNTIEELASSSGVPRYSIPFSDTAVTSIVNKGTDTDGTATTVIGSTDIVGSDGDSLLSKESDGKVHIGENSAGKTGLIINDSETSLDITDGDGETVIEKKADGSVHIGENSLVTVEENGVQQLYATNVSDEQININIKKGTDLLIDGVSVAGSLSTNTTDIATNKTSIATNTTDIATNKTSIATNTTDIATNTTSIATNKTSIATNVTNIAANTAEIATYTDSITSNTTAVAALGSDLSAFKASANSQMNYMKSDYSSGIASAVAMSQFNLAQDGFSIGVGRGSYNDENETAFGLGYGGEFKNGTLFKLQASKSGDASGVGLTISF